MPKPAYRWVPEFERTNGDIAAQVGAELGVAPDDDQRDVLDAIYAYDPAEPERPVCFEVATVQARQTGKTLTFEIAALTDLFVFREPIQMWSAQVYDTTEKTFTHMLSLIESNDDYRRLCAKPSMGKGDQAIRLLTGERIEFQARSLKGGRGPTVPKQTLDEALFLRPSHIGAFLPTMATFRRAQVRYASSAGLFESSVLRGIRDRGRAGDDPRLAYFERSTDRKPCLRADCAHAVGVEGCALDDRDLWRTAVATGRISEETLADFRRAMPPEEFAREFLVWWDDPPNVGGALDHDRWLSLAADPPPLSAPVFGADLDEAGAGWIAVAWTRPDGKVHVQLAGQATVSTLASRCAELTGKWSGRVLAGGGAAAVLEGSEVVSSAEFAASCLWLEELLASGGIHHCDEAALNESVRVARWRKVGTSGERAWQLKDAPGIGPLAAVTRALHGLANVRPSDFYVI